MHIWGVWAQAPNIVLHSPTATAPTAITASSSLGSVLGATSYCFHYLYCQQLPAGVGGSATATAVDMPQPLSDAEGARNVCGMRKPAVCGLKVDGVTMRDAAAIRERAMPILGKAGCPTVKKTRSGLA